MTLFPERLRRHPTSLRSLSEDAIFKWLIKIVKRPVYMYVRIVPDVREFLRKHLPVQIRTKFLEKLNPTDRWEKTCLQEPNRMMCLEHSSCKLVYHDCYKLLELLFSPDIPTLNLNLKRIRMDLHSGILRMLTRMFRTFRRPHLFEPQLQSYPRLTNLILSGGNSNTDQLVRIVEDLCYRLGQTTRGLTHLHLPVMSNYCAKYLSILPNLISLKSDRTKDFDVHGLRYLSSENSATRSNLQDFHLGVFKHRRFDKLDVTRFFVKMSALKSLSLLDEKRSLIQMTEDFSNCGEKIFVYSVLRLSIISAEQAGNISRMTYKMPDGKTTFRSKLVELSIVDRQLKPSYLLEACPDLTKLSIDWQHELSLLPYRQYESDWFTSMLNLPEWNILGSKLSYLDITFPVATNLVAYNLPLLDFNRLITSCSNLTYLRLVGAGRNGDPIPLLYILQGCRRLLELHLVKTRMYLPNVHQHFDKAIVHTTIRKFSHLSDFISLLWNPLMTQVISLYMPNLVELEIQPENATDFEGFHLNRLLDLTSMPNLVRLSIPLSLDSCIMNMPELVVFLARFQVLKSLVLSWGLMNLESLTSRIEYLIRWLQSALKAENANISAQLDYTRHPNIFHSNG